jgi:hypothetical protein
MEGSTGRVDKIYSKECPNVDGKYEPSYP